jgi:hypothetical protein
MGERCQKYGMGPCMSLMWRVDMRCYTAHRAAQEGYAEDAFSRTPPPPLLQGSRVAVEQLVDGDYRAHCSVSRRHLIM